MGETFLGIKADVPIQAHEHYCECQGIFVVLETGKLFVPCRCRARIRAPSCRPCTIRHDHGRHPAHSTAEDSVDNATSVKPHTTNMSSVNAFPVLESSASLRGPQFQANRKSWETLIQKFETMSKAAMAEGEARHTDRHQSRGQLLGENGRQKHCGCEAS